MSGAGTSVAETVGVDGRRTRWAAHRVERRAAFVDAGVRAIDEFGPGANAEQMGEAAGVSRTVLYRYFKDRDDLRQAISDEIVEKVTASVLPHLVLDSESTPHEVITSTVGTIIAWFDEHPHFYEFLREQQSSQALGAAEATLADRVAFLLKGLMLFFGLDGEEAEPTAYGIVGFVESSCAWWLGRRVPGSHGPAALSRERFTRAVCESIWRMLEGFGRANAITIDYDRPLPFAALPAARS